MQSTVNALAPAGTVRLAPRVMSLSPSVFRTRPPPCVVERRRGATWGQLGIVTEIRYFLW